MSTAPLPIPAWFEYAKGLPQDLPDTAYDAMRDKYFQEQVAPQVLTQGYGLEPARQQFMQGTERQDKASYPRAELVGRTAVKALAAPLSLIDRTQYEHTFEHPAEAAAAEASKQGINPAPYEFGGEMLGQAPYWAAGMGAVGAAGKALEAGPTIQKVINTIGASLIQGSYDAAKAPAGQRTIDGMKGAAGGALMVGGLEALGGVVGGLMSRGVAPEAAAAVEKVAKGAPDESQLAAAATTAASQPDVQELIKKQVSDLAAATKSVGVPESSVVETLNKRVKIQMTGADGKPYNIGGVVGMKLEDMPKILDRIKQHLDNGGAINQVAGDPRVVDGFYRQIEELKAADGTFDLQLPDRAEPLKNDAAGVQPPITTPKLPKELAGAKPRYQNLQLTFENDIDRASYISAQQTPSARDADYIAWAAQKLGVTEPEVRMRGREIKRYIKQQASQLEEGVDTLTIPNYSDTSAEPMFARKQVTPSDIPFSELSLDDKIKRLRDQVTNVPQEDEPNIPSFADEGSYRPNDINYPGQPDLEQQLRQSLEQKKFPGVKFAQNLGDYQVVDSLGKARGLPFKELWKAQQAAEQFGHSYTVRVPKAVAALMEQEYGRESLLGMEVEGLGRITGYSKGEGSSFSSLGLTSDQFAQLQSPEELVTPPERSDVRYKETPLAHRIVGDIPILSANEATGASITPFAGDKPYMLLSPEADRATLFHENLHGHIGYLGIRNDFVDHLEPQNIVREIFNRGFSKDAQETYADRGWAEEVYVHAATALRTGDQAMLDTFAEADTDLPHVLDWLTTSSKKLQDLASEQTDSLHKRTLERRMNSVVSRASAKIEDIRSTVAQSGLSVDYNDGRFSVRDGGAARYFDTRDSVVEWLESKGTEPLNSPELVDDALVSAGTPRFARDIAAHSITRPPVTSTPTGVEEMVNDPLRAGASLASRYIRPFYDWLSTVVGKTGKQELWDAFFPLDGQVTEMNNFIRPYGEVLRDTIGKYDSKRQSDLMKLLMEAPAHRQALVDEFHFTPEELGDLADLQEQFMDPLRHELGHDLGDYLQDKLPKIIANDYNPERAFPRTSQVGEEKWLAGKVNIFKDGLATGEISPRDTNLIRLAANYLRMGARQKFMGEQLDKAAELVNETNEDGSYALGLLRTPLARHIEYMRGIPDHTQRVAESVVGAAVSKINEGIEAVNSKLPESMQLGSIDSAPRDVLGKAILFNYAGALALKPALLVRDMAQLLLTTLPILGRYTWTGLERVFPIIKEGVESDAYKIPLKYGALIEKNDLQSLTGDTSTTNWANKALSFIQWSHNSNRLAAFWGHEAMAKDALEEFAATGDQDKLIKDSGMWFMSDQMRQHYLQESMMQKFQGEDLTDLSRKIAKEMVELTQWNFKKGANPGIYEYQLGRLFGQYGTWPLNYIEYARRFVAGSDKTAAMQAITRLVLTHGAVIAAGEAAGVDLAHWTFTQPMAYGGGPALEILTNLPQSMDFETQRGSEARSELRRAFFPGMIPGGAAFETTLKAVQNDDPNLWLRILGFSPLDDKEQLRGIHQVF